MLLVDGHWYSFTTVILIFSGCCGYSSPTVCSSSFLLIPVCWSTKLLADIWKNNCLNLSKSLKRGKLGFGRELTVSTSQFLTCVVYSGSIDCLPPIITISLHNQQLLGYPWNSRTCSSWKNGESLLSSYGWLCFFASLFPWFVSQ